MILKVNNGYHVFQFLSGKIRCSHFGELENGYITPTKFTYYPGDEVEITCQPGFELKEDIKPKCLADGKWSTILPLCTNSSLSAANS